MRSILRPGSEPPSKRGQSTNGLDATVTDGSICMFDGSQLSDGIPIVQPPLRGVVRFPVMHSPPSFSRRSSNPVIQPLFSSASSTWTLPSRVSSSSASHSEGLGSGVQYSTDGRREGRGAGEQTNIRSGRVQQACHCSGFIRLERYPSSHFPMDPHGFTLGKCSTGSVAVIHGLFPDCLRT
jgi:hypothetical protein